MPNFHPPPQAAEFEAPIIVLDTNVVLDWLVFRNPHGLSVGRAVKAGCARWAATREMRDELEHVLARGILDRWAPDLAMVFSAWAEHAIEVDALPPEALPTLRCRDADDQKFIALSLQMRNSNLLSHDRAVLELARRAHAFGLNILKPADWLAQMEKGQPESCP